MFLNKNLLSVILISDTILLATFTILSAISTLTNVYYLIPFAFFVLILGGLELSLSLLLVLT